MALGVNRFNLTEHLETPPAEGKYNLSSADEAFNFYRTAIEERDRWKKETVLDDHAWRHVAYWQGIIDVYESLMRSKLVEMFDYQD